MVPVRDKGEKTTRQAERAPVPSAAEGAAIPKAWNDTAADFPDACAHTLFERQVRRTPDAVAVVFEDRRLTYRELNQRANQVAHYLRKAGVSPDSLVGVSLKRCPELVVALLAVWKAGAAYVPLDPAYPPERLAFMVGDAGIRMLLTDTSCLPLFPSVGGRALCLDDDWGRIAQQPSTNPRSGASPTNLAYVMYTSGSTGQPKGAMILHRGLVNYLWWAIRAYGAAAGGSVPVHSSISFDLTVTSLYPILLAGGHAELLPEDVGAQNLLAALRRNGHRNLVKITPAHLDLLGQQLRPDELGGVTKTFVIGGENLLAESVQIWRDFAPATRLINEYGPTETVVGCCVYEVAPGDPHNGSIPIGRPIANTQLYVLDGDLRPVPVGETGELYIGGAGVARGYLNRPELTAERFLVDRFSGREGARLYKTGDLARYRPDGVLEYLGRIDNQVKIRGYRIELGEIEGTLAGHADVQSCAVLAREDTPGNKQLVGYAVLREGATRATDGLSDFLKRRLPEYMVPTQLVLLESMPLTQNGKVDRKALPAPSEATLAAAKPTVAPRNDTEKALADIWAQLLNVPTVGVHDDFFELGAHSLLVIKAVSRIRDVLGVELPPQTLFESSTVAGLAAEIMRTQGTPAEEAPPKVEVGRIPPRSQPGPYPLSFAQEQFWLLDQMVPGSPAYNIPDVIDLHGAYDAQALQGALRELVRRHEILRTAFAVGEEGLQQVVLPAVELPVPEIDLTALPEGMRAEAWNRVVREQGCQPFDLAQPPLIRVAMVHHSPTDHRLLLVMHHIVGDEWAMGLVQEEVRQTYAALSRGQPSPLLELPVQYADYACWQRDWFQGERLEVQQAYWQGALAGASPVLLVPTDKPRPPALTFRGTNEQFVLPKALLDRLRALGHQEQATLFMVLEAAFASLLHRYSGQTDLLVGTPISGRTHSETQHLVGCFLNTVVLRSQFDDGQTFRNLLRQTRERALGAFAHAELPFARLVATLASERDPSRTPLFQAMFVLFDPESTSRISNVSGHRELETGTSKFDVTLFISITEGGLVCGMEYSTDLFEAETIRRMCRHFGVLLEGLAHRPDQPIGRLPILTEADRQQLLVEWNDTDTVFPEAGMCLHELFARQAQRTPEAVAVLHGRDAMTYGELDRRSNQLAHHLMELGVGPDVLVGLLVERSPEMMVALLSILKAGGAYVPLDPGFPSERLDHMVSNSKMPVLVTQGELAQMLHVHPSAIVRLDLDREAIAKHGVDTPVPAGLGGRHLAYVLYTSGSTGVPKGVAIPHSAIVNFLLSMQREPGFTAADAILAVTTLSFDIAGLELYLPLVSGAKVAIASRDDAMDPYRLMDRLREHGCTMLQATPATWRALLTAGWSGSPGLKALCGGEAMPLDLARELLPRCAELWNMYGPTETTVWSTVYRITSAETQAPIGRPIANTQTYVLDRSGQLVPPGVVGELYIGGSGLARGYLYRPELTQERFVPSSFAPDARLYRTGDWARWRADGILECLGRSDHQVKIRGFRVELGEIEAGIARHPSIRQVVVVAREDVPGDKRLVAYFVAEDPPSDLVEQLRRQVRALMPEYMVPSHFLALEAFPLSPNGKIDRKALPAPSGDDAVVVCEGVGPRNQTEALLVSIWSELLGVAKVGIDDNFFELGGHSLLAIKAMSRVRDAFKVDLPLRRLFESPTVAGIAAAVSKAKGATSPVRRIEPRTQPGPYPLSFAQEQFWLLDQMVPGSPAYNIPDVIDLHGAYDAQALQGALRELVRRHEILRTAFAVGEEGLQQVVLPAVELPVPEIDLTALPEGMRAEAWNRVVREQGCQPFDLAQPPLIRVAMVHHSPTDHRLLLVMHHIVGDEWAMGLVQEEVRQTYAALSRGQPSPLLELPVQYADYACWQRDWFQGERLEVQVAYWQEALAEASPVLLLPTDKPRPPALTFRGATEEFVVPKALLDRLRALGHQEQATLFMVLEAAFASLLHRYSGQTDLLVGTPISGRTHSETQHLVGCFLNTVVLRSQFDDGQTFRNLLHQTRERALGAFAHAELPFARLVATLAPKRDPSRTPLFQAMFVLLDPDSASRSSILSGHRELETGTSKFEVTLFISITEDGLVGEMEYSTDLFEAETIRRMCGHFGVLLEGLAHRPDQPIGRLPILTEADTQQLLVEWNRTESDYPRAEPLAQLIEAQVARTPEAVAVVYGNQSLTYAELDASANQLAHELRGRGIGPDGLVGIYLERSLDLVVGLLAIIKAGGAYLPLDPFLPAERLRTMLDDSGTTLVLTQESLRATLPAFAGSLCLVDAPSWRSRPRDNPGVAVAPEQLAYVIYTSGSTGKPKGVEVPRGALTNLLWSMRDWLGLTAQDRVLAVTTISFDIAGVDMWLPLLVGARLVVASREQAVDGDSLREQVDRHGITFLQATPVTWRLLLAAGFRGRADLQMVCTGEAMPRELAAALLPLGRRLWNLYGPTETTIWSTGYEVRDGNTPVLIGRPVANTHCYVLDANRRPVPVGVVGELYVGGDGLARGYLGRPELTAEKFVPDPFHTRPGARLYRTGDLACYQADGNLVCLGRSDHQVKLRGFRVEPGEIEAGIAQHPAIRQVVVAAREDVPGDRRLVAYFVAENSPPDLVEQLRLRLRAVMPEYMVPSHFVALGALPLSPNGKVDRKALPAPDLQAAPAPVRPPSTVTEKRIAAVWTALLKREGIGVDDNFFDVGGHSLLSVMLVAEIRKQLGVDLPLSQILHSPTIAGLAAAIDTIAGPKPDVVLGEENGIVEIKPGGRKRLFFVYDGFGEVLPYLNLARRMPSQYGVYGILPRRRPSIPLAHLSVPDMADYCVEQMRRRQPNGPYTIGGLCAGGVIAFAMAEQLERCGQAVDRVVLLDAIAPTASVKRWRVATERWQRFSSVLRRAWQPQQGGVPGPHDARPAPAERVDGIANELLRKLKNLVAYEGFTVVESASVAVRLRLLKYLLASGREWPAWIPPLGVPEIYADAYERYTPGQVDANLVLVRAGGGDGADLPAVSVVVDPLFGWGERSRRAVEVIDAPGGHSSMLQESNVDVIASRLSQILAAESVVDTVA